jgi:hypothetical protein
VTLLTEVPDDWIGRQIEAPRASGSFAIVLDRAEPWGGGRVEGRIEAREGRHDPRAVSVSVVLHAAWLDVAPQLVGQKRLLSITTYWDLRTRGIPIWIDDEVWRGRVEPGDLGEANWLPFSLVLPPELPRVFEGTFIAFRYRIEAARARRVGREVASLPLLLREVATIPVVRAEASPLGSWRLLEHRAEGERDGTAGRCSVRYEERGPDDREGAG